MSSTFATTWLGIERYVHPLFEQMKCSACHHESGEAEEKPFADDNITTAYTSALEVVAFGDIENSALIKKQREGHQCNKNSGECDNNIEELVEALAEWQKSRAGEQPSYVFTAAKDAEGSTSTLEFSLESLLKNPTGMVTLAVTVTKNIPAQLLTISNFKLTSPSDSIFIGGIKARRNGIDSAVMSLDRVCALINKGAESKALPQYSEIAFSLTDGDHSPDKISIGLKDLRIATSEETCEGESVDGNGNNVAGDNHENEFNNKDSGMGKIISDGCTSSCHNSTAQEADLSTFELFHSKRDQIRLRVQCQGKLPTDNYCMPRNKPEFTPEQRKQLLNWLEKLPWSITDKGELPL